MFVSLILNLGFEASMSLIAILLCSLNLACYKKRGVEKKKFEKMYASSMPYIAMYIQKKKKNMRTKVLK